MFQQYGSIDGGGSLRSMDSVDKGRGRLCLASIVGAGGHSPPKFVTSRTGPRL